MYAFKKTIIKNNEKVLFIQAHIDTGINPQN